MMAEEVHTGAEEAKPVFITDDETDEILFCKLG